MKTLTWEDLAVAPTQWRHHERPGQPLAAGLAALRRRLGLDTAIPVGRPSLCLSVIVGNLQDTWDNGGGTAADRFLSWLVDQLLRDSGMVSGNRVGGGVEIGLLVAATSGEWLLALTELLEPLAAWLHAISQQPPCQSPPPHCGGRTFCRFNVATRCSKT
eukprot:SAG31_NODE_119_length_23948_cov_9.957105_11_plen_160_part_00